MVVLVVLLRLGERGGRNNFGHERLAEPARCRKVCLGLLGQPLLLIVVIEDDRAVLRAAVDELAARIRRIDLPPEDVQ